MYPSNDASLSLIDWLAGLIVGRDLGLAAGSAWLYYRSKQIGSVLEVLQRLAPHLRPTLLSKTNTVLQMALLASCLLKQYFPIPSLAFDCLQILVGSSTIASGWQYWQRRRHLLK